MGNIDKVSNMDKMDNLDCVDNMNIDNSDDNNNMELGLKAKSTAEENIELLINGFKHCKGSHMRKLGMDSFLYQPFCTLQKHVKYVTWAVDRSVDDPSCYSLSFSPYRRH